ncbi:Uncharacterised protein [Mycobacteroides abscessus subsp. abscessus]|nr:Uncharacterised protein [Mycobacteroides abscessus subsp. abscessus]
MRRCAQAFMRLNQVRLWVISAMPFKVWRIVKGLALCVNIADMVLGRCITNNQVCCIMVSLDKA